MGIDTLDAPAMARAALAGCPTALTAAGVTVAAADDAVGVGAAAAVDPVPRVAAAAAGVAAAAAAVVHLKPLVAMAAAAADPNYGTRGSARGSFYIAIYNIYYL